MEENKEIISNERGNIVKKNSFFFDLLRGVGIGLAFIIPGFSGGSVAAILGIYEKLIGAVAGLLTSFKKSFITLLPIAIGLVIGAVSLLFPIKWALSEFAFPTVSLFVGLTVGCLPTLLENVRGKFKWTNVLSLSFPMILTLLLSFAPVGNDVDLYSLTFFGYVLLFLIGIIGSSALVIPGISGSMLLLILGYYNPIVGLITDLIKTAKDIILGNAYSMDVLISAFLVLFSVALGIAVGFVGISVIMKKLFEKAPRGTYLAIIGFIIGSLPTVFASTYKDGGFTPDTLPASPLYWIACAVMLVIGIGISLFLVIYSKKKSTQDK